MANEEQVAILRQGVEVWNKWCLANLDAELDLQEANLIGMNLTGINLAGANLISANLTGAFLLEANLTEANLTEANLSWVNLTDSVLRNATLRRATLRQATLREADLTRADLTEGDLTGVDLTRAVLTRAVLTEAILRKAVLERANLIEANLAGAILAEASLSTATLIVANLTEANLTGTDFSWVDFTGATLTGAVFTDAVAGRTIFANVDLHQVQGLESLRHFASSTVGIDTLYKSAGQIPEVFLRGCGVPDSLIEYLPSLIGATQPIQFYSCFISHSTKDEAFAKRLHSRMQQEHLRVWYAPEELKGGRKLGEQIDYAIRVYDKLLLILSEESMASTWVAHEIRRAHTREQREGKRVLFPIRLCDFESLADWELPDGMGRDLALEVRHYYIPDFSTWKDHDAFEAAFAQLLKALRADEKDTVKQ